MSRYYGWTVMPALPGRGPSSTSSMASRETTASGRDGSSIAPRWPCQSEPRLHRPNRFEYCHWNDWRMTADNAANWPPGSARLAKSADCAALLMLAASSPAIAGANARRTGQPGSGLPTGGGRPFPFVDPERLLWEMSLITQDPIGRLHAPTSSVGGGSEKKGVSGSGRPRHRAGQCCNQRGVSPIA